MIEWNLSIGQIQLSVHDSIYYFTDTPSSIRISLPSFSYGELLNISELVGKTVQKCLQVISTSLQYLEDKKIYSDKVDSIDTDSVDTLDFFEKLQIFRKILEDLHEILSRYDPWLIVIVNKAIIYENGVCYNYTEVFEPVDFQFNKQTRDLSITNGHSKEPKVKFGRKDEKKTRSGNQRMRGSRGSRNFRRNKRSQYVEEHSLESVSSENDSTETCCLISSNNPFMKICVESGINTYKQSVKEAMKYLNAGMTTGYNLFLDFAYLLPNDSEEEEDYNEWAELDNLL